MTFTSELFNTRSPFPPIMLTMLTRTPIRQVSEKRRIQNAEYSRLRRIFLDEYRECPVAKTVLNLGSRRATEVHHIAGREGKLLLDQSKWLAVSRMGHRWIHDNPREARMRGWLK